MTTRRGRHKEKPPSRVKYEANNPVVSARLALESYKRLKEVMEMSGLFLSDVIVMGMDSIEADPDRSYEDGFEAGFEEDLRQFEGN